MGEIIVFHRVASGTKRQRRQAEILPFTGGWHGPLLSKPPVAQLASEKADARRHRRESSVAPAAANGKARRVVTRLSLK